MDWEKNAVCALLFVFAAAGACSGRPLAAPPGQSVSALFPAGIAYAWEMAYIPEVDGWERCAEGQFAEDSLKAAVAWERLHAWVRKQYSPSTVRALSGWAKKQMLSYKCTPVLKGIPLVPVRVRQDQRKLVFEAVADSLPVHQANVKRYLKLYVLYDMASGTIVSVTITIRGDLLE